MECQKLTIHLYKIDDKEKERLEKSNMKCCRHCGEVKRIELYDFTKSKKYIKARRADCKACRKDRNAKYYQLRKAKAQALKVSQMVEE